MDIPGDETSSPWHPGELALQRVIGFVERLDKVGRRAILDFLVDQHRAFYAQLPFIVIGSVDSSGDAWATLRAGTPGFLNSPDPTHLDVKLARDTTDPADQGIEHGEAIGMLGIELQTRRRNRMNGIVQRQGGDGFSVLVKQAYGNCPQYIQLRDFTFVSDPAERWSGSPVRGTALDDQCRAIIASADTFFVASYVDLEGLGRQVDVSHRGGRAGFVRIGDDSVLTIPDFTGNRFFNTLGNFVMNPKAGLVFADFQTGALLQLTGEAEVVLDSPEIDQFIGAERFWRFHPREWILRPAALPLRWNFLDGGWSPNVLRTGSWSH